jgi:hypothetical protein
MRNDEHYILVEDSSDESYFCPLGAAEDDRAAEKAIRSDLCVETAVAGRYAGQIQINRN